MVVNLKSKKKIILSFDIEKFVIPEELNINYKNINLFRKSHKWIIKIIQILNEFNIKWTFFISYDLALLYPSLCREISDIHEVWLHCFKHEDNYSLMKKSEIIIKLSEAKVGIEKIIWKTIVWFRPPQLKLVNYLILKELWFKYSSTLHPTYVPWRYNNIFTPRKIKKHNDITEIPITVLPFLRIPFSWIWFRYFPLFLLKVFTSLCFLVDDYICLYFHPWDFLNSYTRDYPHSNILNILMYNWWKNLTQKLRNYIVWCNEKWYNFCTIRDYLSQRTL